MIQVFSVSPCCSHHFESQAAYERWESLVRVTALFFQVVCLLGILGFAKVGLLSSLSDIHCSCLVAGGFLSFLYIKYISRHRFHHQLSEISNWVKSGVFGPSEITIDVFKKSTPLSMHVQKTFNYNETALRMHLRELLNGDYHQLKGRIEVKYTTFIRILKFTMDVRASGVTLNSEELSQQLL